MTEPIVAIVPCRAGSERVRNKNTRPFAGFEGGLLELKLRQLSAQRQIEKIIVSSNDPVVLDYAKRFADSDDSRIVPLERPDELGRSSTPMSTFIRYMGTLEDDGVMMMVHVTHPFVTSEVMANLITAYAKATQDGHDSLFTVTRMHKFMWDSNGPFNYDNTVEKWPRSQDIPPLFEINHAGYLIPFRTMRETDDRIGNRPFLHEIPESVAMDIDWEEQFTLLNDIALSKLSRNIPLI